MEIDLKRLGENIRYLRQGKNWSLSDLSRGSGVSKAYISDLENGSGGRPNIQHLYKIAEALGSAVGTLVDRSLTGGRTRKPIHEDRAEALPPGLEQFTRQERLEPQEVQMLAKLNFRGSRPRDAEGWRLIYQAIKFASRREERVHRDAQAKH
jgi:transcriptional regulator with XRE-family HTH domain